MQGYRLLLAVKPSLLKPFRYAGSVSAEPNKLAAGSLEVNNFAVKRALDKEAIVSFSTTLSSEARATQCSLDSVSTQPDHSQQSSSTLKLAQRINATSVHQSAGSTALLEGDLPSNEISEDCMPHPLLPGLVHRHSAGAKYHDLRHSGTQLLAGLQSRLAVPLCNHHLYHFQLYASLLQICGQTVLRFAILPAMYQCGQHVPGSITTSLGAVHSHLDSLSTTQLKVRLPWWYAHLIYSGLVQCTLDVWWIGWCGSCSCLLNCLQSCHLCERARRVKTQHAKLCTICSLVYADLPSCKAILEHKFT